MKRIKQLAGIALGASAFLLTSCMQVDIEPGIEGVPSCIKKKIRKTYRGTSDKSGRAWRVEVGGKTYYQISGPCCDRFSYMYDENCNQVCAYSGGLNGEGDGTCPEFEGEAVTTLIWEKED